MKPMIFGLYLFWFSQALNFGDAELNPYLEKLRAHPWKSVQGYFEIRPGAFMFYWFYFADGISSDAHKKPLIIWVQGGPGFAASGVGNFAEIGPLNMDFELRNHTWVKQRNLLLFDHPVDTGFSYVTKTSLLVKTDKEMASDLTKAIKMFYRKHKEFRKTPTYIIGQSYGGKICPRLACYLNSAITRKRLKMNFKGIGIGSGWVDPKESTLVLPDSMLALGIIDYNTYMDLRYISHNIARFIEKKNYTNALTMLHTRFFETTLSEVGMPINFNNVNQDSPYPALAKLDAKVNAYVKPTLAHVVHPSFKWKYSSDKVFDYMNATFLVPSVNFLEVILNTTNLKVTVYNGNLDIVTPLAGAVKWVHKLKWSGAQEFKTVRRVAIQGHKNGFYKQFGPLSFWTVFRAGHWVPEDNAEAMQQILDHLTTEK